MSDRQPSKYCCVAALRWRMRLRKPAHPEAVPHDGGPLRRFRRCRRPFPLRPRLAQALRPEPSLAPLSAGKRLRKELRSEEHTSELQSLMRISYAVFCLKKNKEKKDHTNITQ